MHHLFRRYPTNSWLLHSLLRRGGFWLVFLVGILIPMHHETFAEQYLPYPAYPTELPTPEPAIYQFKGFFGGVFPILRNTTSTTSSTSTTSTTSSTSTTSTTSSTFTTSTTSSTSTTPTTLINQPLQQPPLAFLEQDVPFYYAPEEPTEPQGIIRQGTGYTLTARYGWDWLQAHFVGYGTLWTTTDALPSDSATLAMLPNLASGVALVFPETMLQPGELVPRLPQATTAYYVPVPHIDNATATLLPATSPYDVEARYGWDWVQSDVLGLGVFWMYAPDVGLDTVDLTPLPDLAPLADYRAYEVAEGDTLASIAEAGGSEPSIIRHYNHTHEPPLPGQPLIIPRLEGCTSTLPEIPLLVRKGNPTQPRVAITLDVEVGDASKVLEVLRQRNTRVTFFVTGGWAKSHPDLLRQMVADGHELGNHSMGHPDFRTINDGRIAWELAETERIVHEITGATTRPYFRPPYGGYDHRVLLAVIRQGYLPVYWSLDTQDAVGMPKSPNYVLERMTRHTAPEQMPGMISLSHCCANQHVLGEALWAILDRYDAMGIEARPLSEVLGP